MRVQLTGGAYQSRSVIASAQSCINLYGEAIPQAEGEPGRFVYYPTPGLSLVHIMSMGGPIRGIYYASNATLWVVANSAIVQLSVSLVETVVGYLTTTSGPVSMVDNTETLFVVDGSPIGVQVDLPTLGANQLTAADNYNGSTYVDYYSTFTFFNEPGTPQFYCTDSGTSTIDPLYFANKSGGPDYLVAAVEARGTIWLIGRQTSEVWTLSGAADFPFQALPSVLIEHGCWAQYSIAKADGSIFFLGRDLQGLNVVFRASGYQVNIVSTPAITDQINAYSRTDDAQGYTYQREGHIFYVLTFPSGDATWVYDETNEQWHQWATQDANGAFHRHRGACFANGYGSNFIGDYETGNLYTLDLNNYTDNNVPITRVRAFPHLLNDGKRVSYAMFAADMECGNVTTDGSIPYVNLSWSDDRGATYGVPVPQTIGATGATLTQPMWRRLGMARDRVFQLSWSAPTRTALQGAFVEMVQAGT